MAFQMTIKFGVISVVSNTHVDLNADIIVMYNCVILNLAR
jgi:hypothetical protein